MWIDPIIEELHGIREAHAARFNNDLYAIVADMKRLEQNWPGTKIDPVFKSSINVSCSNHESHSHPIN